MFAPGRRWWLAATLLAMVVGSTAARAQDAEADKPAPPAADRYAVPATNDVDQLAAYIDALRGFQPNNAEEFFAHRSKAPAAMKAAAEKIMALKPDAGSKAYVAAQTILIRDEIGKIAQLDPAGRAEVLAKVLGVLGDGPLEGENLSLGFGVASGLEYAGSRDLAAKAYLWLADSVEKHPNERLKNLPERLRGAARRMSLDGQPLQVTGVDMDGQQFNWASYRGKVVLVDFWATWCGPCRAELPNVKKLYEQYHDQGFEVVAISIDQNRQALETYLKEQSIPWTNLHEPNPEAEQPTASYYGVFSIPTMILVDRDGKVISLEARGAKLRELLAAQFDDQSGE